MASLTPPDDREKRLRVLIFPLGVGMSTAGNDFVHPFLHLF
jgi:hypothetical protein